MKHYNYGKIIIPNVNRQHPTAKTGLDRKSTFYDRILAKEFKKNFQFEYPEEENEELQQENNLVLRKKRIK